MENQKYFKKDIKRYTTRRIYDEVDPYIQCFLWNLVDNLSFDNDTEIDYLQVFELSKLESTDEEKTENMLVIKHTQEIPEYEKTYIIPAQAKMNCKIFCIDDGSCATMLFAEEY